jgi:hypothetical protein
MSKAKQFNVITLTNGNDELEQMVIEYQDNACRHKPKSSVEYNLNTLPKQSKKRADL